MPRVRMFPPDPEFYIRHRTLVDQAEVDIDIILESVQPAAQARRDQLQRDIDALFKEYGIDWEEAGKSDA